MPITTEYFISTSQSSKTTLRKSAAKTCDKSRKPKNSLITTKFVSYIRSEL